MKVKNIISIGDFAQVSYELHTLMDIYSDLKRIGKEILDSLMEIESLASRAKNKEEIDKILENGELDCLVSKIVDNNNNIVVLPTVFLGGVICGAYGIIFASKCYADYTRKVKT